MPASNGTKKTKDRPIIPVGVMEIAEMLDVRQDTVNKWRDRDLGFPEPEGWVSGFPAWDRPVVVAWAKETGRL